MQSCYVCLTGIGFCLMPAVFFDALLAAGRSGRSWLIGYWWLLQRNKQEGTARSPGSAML
jgi:hypothetical protein